MGEGAAGDTRSFSRAERQIDRIVHALCGVMAEEVAIVAKTAP